MTLKSGTEIFPTLGDNLAQREAAILSYVRDGNFAICWMPMKVTYGPYTATFMMSADALRLGHIADSFRVTATASTYQKIADELGATLLTPKLLDDWYKQSFTVKLPPTTLPVEGMSSMAAMKKASDAIDVKAAQKMWPASSPQNALASSLPFLMSGCLPITNDGKYWVLSTYVSNQGPIKAWGKPALPGTFASENYGFYVAPGAGTATIPGVGVIQGPGHAHDYAHSDYSQSMRFVRRTVNVCKDGVCKDIDIYKLAQDPAMAPLVNHEKVAINMRYPRVAWSPSTAAQSLWGNPSGVSGFGANDAAAAMQGGWGSKDKGETGPRVINKTPPPNLPPDPRVIEAINSGKPLPSVLGVSYSDWADWGTGALWLGAGATAGWLAWKAWEGRI